MWIWKYFVWVIKIMWVARMLKLFTVLSSMFKFLNYFDKFDVSTKLFSDMYLVKFLNTFVKSFFSRIYIYIYLIY